MGTDHGWSWMDDGIPFVAMLMVQCLDMAVLNVTKEAMNDGLGSIVYVIYHNALGTFILLPFFIVHIIRKVDRPPLTFRIMFKFFILGLLGICLFQVLWFIGVDYSSPTMASAIVNLSPGITFLIAVLLRTEKIDIRSSSSVAKLLGTMFAISGATVFTFYQGPMIFQTLGSANRRFISQASSWIFGSLITLVGVSFDCMWSVLQTKTTREYRDQQTIIFFYCLFGTIQCIAISPFLVQNRSAWVLEPGIKVTVVVLGTKIAREYRDQQTIIFFYCLFGTIQCIAVSPFLVQNRSSWVLEPGIKVTVVVLGAVYSTVVRNNILTWCLKKKGPIFVTMFSPLSIILAVVMGVTILGDSLHLGSVIGAMIIASGFYTVMWGQAKEKNKKLAVTNDTLDGLDEHGSSDDQTAHLLSSRTEAEY